MLCAHVDVVGSIDPASCIGERRLSEVVEDHLERGSEVHLPAGIKVSIGVLRRIDQVSECLKGNAALHCARVAPRMIGAKRAEQGAYGLVVVDAKLQPSGDSVRADLYSWEQEARFVCPGFLLR